ncbi:hypothetical protein KDK77_09885, partial [bacterium]|nr:hypothetical protein [bacterium]
TYFVLFLIILYSVCLGYSLYNNSRTTSKILTEFVQQNPRLEQKLESIDKGVLAKIIAAMLINALVIAYIGIFSTHKVAGPIYRFKKHLENIRSGDYESRTKLRKNDLLTDVADDLNKTSEYLATVQEKPNNTGECAHKLKNLSSAIKNDKISGKDITIAIDDIISQLTSSTSSKKNN